MALRIGAPLMLLLLWGGCARGRPWVVGDIRFSGNDALSRGTLIRSMQSRPSRLWKVTRFSSSRLQEDIRLIHRLYQDQGYLDAEVTVARVERDTASRRVRVRIGISVGLGIAVRLWSRFEWNRFPVRDSTLPLPETGTTNIRSVGATLTYDTRNSVLNPRRGVLNSIDGEIAGLAGTNRFVRITADSRFYRSMLGIVTWSSALNIGLIQGYGTDRGFVAPQEWFLPGSSRIRPLRGYAHERDSGGTLAAVINVGEIMATLYRFIDAAVFVDAGYVWRTPAQASWEDLLWSAGPGLRVKTPIGPAAVDLGFRLSGPHAGRSRIHLSMGQPF